MAVCVVRAPYSARRRGGRPPTHCHVARATGTIAMHTAPPVRPAGELQRNHTRPSAPQIAPDHRSAWWSAMHAGECMVASEMLHGRAMGVAQGAAVPAAGNCW